MASLSQRAQYESLCKLMYNAIEALYDNMKVGVNYPAGDFLLYISPDFSKAYAAFADCIDESEPLPKDITKEWHKERIESAEDVEYFASLYFKNGFTKN